MTLNEQIKEELSHYLSRQSKDISLASIYKKIAEKLGVHPERVRKHHRMLKDNTKRTIGYYAVDFDKLKVPSYVLTTSGTSTHVNVEKGTYESNVDCDYEPKSPEELRKLHKVGDEYKISSYWSKDRGNGKFTSSILATLKKPSDMSPTDLLQTLSKYKSDYKPLTKKDVFVNPTFTSPCSAFIDITDFHLDKRDLKETPIEKKVEDYFRLLDVLITKAYQSNMLEEIAFVVGSDMLHTDNFFNQTTKSTQQETTVRWNEAFDIAFDIYVKSINRLRQFTDNLKVILVAGNHSRTKEYYLAFALSKYFERDNSIHFDISTAPRKIYTYGNTFIGLHHGNCKIETLPVVFSKEFTKDWGNAKYHHILVGDKHHFMEKDYNGVRIKQLPACSNADTWHNDNNFATSEQSAICIVYDREKGKCMEIEERI